MGAGGSQRGGSLPISFFIQQRFHVPVLAHFTTREKDRFVIENMLIDHELFGLKNILCLRGDPPAGMDKKEFVGEYPHAYLMVKQIRNLNNGIYLDRVHGIREGPKKDFCLAVAGHPEDVIADEIRHMKAKVESGADFIITQMIFDVDTYKKYRDALRAAGIKIPIIPGFRPLTSFKQAESAERFFDVKVPSPLMEELKKLDGNDEESYRFGIAYAKNVIAGFRKEAPGVHLFTLNDKKLILDILE